MENHSNDDQDEEETISENWYLLLDSHMWIYERELAKSHSRLIEKYFMSKPVEETVKVEVFGLDSNNNTIFLIKNETGIQAMNADTLQNDTFKSLMDGKATGSSVQPIFHSSTNCTIDCKKEDLPENDLQRLVLVSEDKASNSVNVGNNSNTSLHIDQHSCLNYLSYEGGTYICVKCRLTFKLSVNPKEHNIINGKMYPVSFEMLEVLNLIKKEVLRREWKPYKCLECGKSYKNKNSVAIHNRVHTGERPYKCDQCHRAFRERATLIKHRVIHCDEKPFPCLKCEKTFRRKYDLQVHQQSKTHTDEKLISCKTCGKMVRGSYMSRHIENTHKAGKRYSCDKCGKSFKSNQHLRRHKLIHEEIGQFPCDICTKTFKQKTNLKTHKLSHGEVRSYACKFCDKRFKQRQGLNSHTLSHTKKK